MKTVMTTARKYVGIKAGSASHKRILAIYNGHKPLARSYAVKLTDNWCATFVSAVLIESGASGMTGTECSVGEYVKIFQRHGIWQENGAITPKVGDIIVYDWSGTDTWPDHIGFVNAVAGGKITALEGNHNGGVNYRVIAVGDKTIRGYARPKYSAAKAPAKAAAKPAAKPATKPTPGGWHAQSGTFTITEPSGIKLRSRSASTGSPLIAVLPKGSVVKYDAFGYFGGYVWIRQPRRGGYGYLPTGTAIGTKRTSSWGLFK
ncbi:CHAP domain-containing protein [Lacticaseibacillus parakribbianus]|uniref:CHAP domain-containing protein n=1 Tax=Lacticaseibacillus parakribbianus TaxID=2970927 RepID=UPI0021CB6C33|nr:CHAP domain-containing protein [Lacticaseibacillus parakribbianus]